MIATGLFDRMVGRTVLLGAEIGYLHNFAVEYRGTRENVLAGERDFQVRSGLLRRSIAFEGMALVDAVAVGDVKASATGQEGQTRK